MLTPPPPPYRRPADKVRFALACQIHDYTNLKWKVKLKKTLHTLHICVPMIICVKETTFQHTRRHGMDSTTVQCFNSLRNQGVTLNNWHTIIHSHKRTVLLLAKIFNFGKYVRLTVCYLPIFSILASMVVWRFVCPSVCLSAWTLWTRYRSHRLTNHHQTWHKYGPLVRTEAYSFSRSKVK